MIARDSPYTRSTSELADLLDRKPGPAARFVGESAALEHPHHAVAVRAHRFEQLDHLGVVDRPANQGRWPGRINDYLCAGRPVITQPVGEMKILLEQEAIGRLCAATRPSASRTIV